MKRSMMCVFALLAGTASGLLAQSVETIPFLTLMQASNEVPAVADTSSGNVIVWVHVVRDSSGAIVSGSVDFDVSTKFSGAVTVTGLHIHNGGPTVAGPIVIPTDVNGTDKSFAVDATGKLRIQKQVQFPQTVPVAATATVVDLLANPQNYYANIHTTDHPGGAMRGQLVRADMKILMGLMKPANENPPVPLSASGVATVTLLRGKDSAGNVNVAEAIFNLEYTGFDTGTVFTGFHIHNGGPTVNGPVIINSGIAGGANSVNADASGAGNLNYLIPMSPQDASFATEVGTVNGLFDSPGNYYINIHTTTFGGGVMRDQLRNTEKSTFQVTMLPSNETPAIAGLAATGPAAVSAYVLRNADGTIAAGTVVFDINFRGFPASTTFTGLHIHQAASGVAGGIVIPTDVNALANKIVSDSGNGNAFKTVTVSSTSGIAALSNLLQNPNGFYVNMHTTVNPGGAMREQLTPALTKPSVTGAATNASIITTVAPGTVLAIYGSGLSAVTSDLSGFPSSTAALATSMNGVSATLGTLKMPIYAVSPSQLVVQVPFEATPGQQALVVTTPGGSSTSINVTVAAVAPSIFILDPNASIGTVVKNVDFSLITSSNAVKAGDAIVVFSTGLGQTSPAMQTGVLDVPPSGGFNTTGTVTASIGGVPATVVYSIASPGFAGVYQTAILVPTGVTGNAKVFINSGTTASNTVFITVQ